MQITKYSHAELHKEFGANRVFSEYLTRGQFLN